jgi:hypothetical protein
MRCLVTSICAFLFILPIVADAGWQVAKPQTVVPSQPFFQAGPPQVKHSQTAMMPTYGAMAFPNHFANLGRPAALYAISVSGSVKENLQRIMDRYHWKVLWKVAYDYNFDGRVTGSSLPDVVEKLLKPFPLQAVMYMSNRTMTVMPRKV